MKIKLKSENMPKARMIALLILLAFCLLPAVQILLFPSKRTGPFGIGLPSPMVQYSSQKGDFSIKYPKSWGLEETPDGAHGDSEIVAVILVPGRSFPQVYIAHKLFPDKDMNKVTLWGQSRAKDRCKCAQNSAVYSDTLYFHGITQEYSWINKTIFASITISCRDWYVLYNTDGYALSFCAYQSHWPQVDSVFREMMNSFSVR
jgi:hypothetical protein